MARIALLVLGLSASAIASDVFTQEHRDLIMSGLRTMDDVFNGKVDSHVNRRQSSCDIDTYVQSIPMDGVDVNEYTTYIQECGTFIVTALTNFSDWSTCKNKCLQPTLSIFTLFTKGTASGCDEYKNSFAIGRALFTDIICTKTAAGKYCGAVLEDLNGNSLDFDSANASQQCMYFNGIGCCYKRLLQTYTDSPLTKDSIKSDAIPTDAQMTTMRDSCKATNASYTAVFADACAVASVENGMIAASDIKSGVSSAHALGVPSVLALVMPIVVAMCTLW